MTEHQRITRKRYDDQMAALALQAHIRRSVRAEFEGMKQHMIDWCLDPYYCVPGYYTNSSL